MAASMVSRILRPVFNFVRSTSYGLPFGNTLKATCAADLTKSIQHPSLCMNRPLHSLPQWKELGSSSNTSLLPKPWSSYFVPSRGVITCSRKRGRMKTVREVPQRFYRLRTGLWIRTICAKRRRHWSRTPEKIHAIRQSVFCNQHQNEMLDKMVSPYYKKPRHWVNNIYEPYEGRDRVTEGFEVPKRKFYP